jgi:excisionase family DNA binding protein
MSKRFPQSLSLNPELIAELADIFVALRDAPPKAEGSPPPIEPLVLRPKDAARALRVSDRTVWTMLRDGRLEATRPSPRLTFISVASVRRLAGR